MKRLALLIAPVLLFLTIGWAPHEFYVSITELHRGHDTVQISIRIFTDDLEYVLKERTGQKVFLQPGGDQDQLFLKIRDYAHDRFHVGSAGKTYTIHWLGHEYVDDVTWIYGEALSDPTSNLLFVDNTLLLDYFPDQQNLVHLKTAGGYDSKLCTRSAHEVRFQLE